VLAIDKADHQIARLIFGFRRNFQEPRVTPEKPGIDEVNGVLGKIAPALRLIELKGKRGMKTIPFKRIFLQESRFLCG